MRVFSRLLLIAALAVSAPAWAEPLIDLQRAVAAAEKRAEQQAAAHDRLHSDTLTALARGAMAAFVIAEQREEAAMVADLQSAAARRRSRQALAEAVNTLIEQADAIERAAVRAARGEVAPSASDLLACDGPDCITVSPREHAALVLMGAVAPSFDRAKWPPEDVLLQITVLHADETPPLATLRAAMEAAAAQAHAAATEADRLRTGVTSETGDAMKAYGEALKAADAARKDQSAAADRLQARIRYFGDVGRALKRAALLAGDGYVLTDRDKVCHRDVCMTVGSRLEAAAFVVVGATDAKTANVKDGYVIETRDGGFVFK